MRRMHVDEVAVDEDLVRRLLADQFPRWSDLPLQIVEPWGTDHGIWRLGEDLVVRLPRIGWAEGQADREATWLPRLAPQLPVAVPEPVAVGLPGHGYPFRWAIHRWLPGELAGPDSIGDPARFGADLAAVVASLRTLDTSGAPPARNRARPLIDYDAATRQAIESAARLVDADAALAVWEEARAARPHEGPPVWVHGDLDGNALVRGGRLAGLVDWGSACAGDPAVDVAVVWAPVLADPAAQDAFLAVLAVDDDALARSRGAAVNQACAALPYYLETYPLIVERSAHKLRAMGIEVDLADR